MTPSQAAAMAFRNCRLNSEESRSTASFLAQQYLLTSGVSRSDAAANMGEINKWLDSWFEARNNNPSFTPDLTSIERVKSATPVVSSASTVSDAVPVPEEV